MNDLLIRFMNEKDDVNVVSSLLLQADKQTYPPLWGDINNQIKAMSYLIDNMPLFSRHKIVVAIYKNEIVGALLFLINGEKFDVEIGKATFSNYDEETASKYQKTVEGYFIPITLFKSKYYILNLAVEEKMRGHGIASQLLSYFINFVGNEDITLEVITENVNALRLYENFSFRAFEEYQTFCLYSNSYRSLHMIRLGNKNNFSL